MNLRRCLVLVLSLWSLFLMGTEPIPVRSVILIHQGKVQITAPDTAASQTLGVWVRQCLSTLEALWQTKIPFQPDLPLEIRVNERGEKVELLESWRDGVLRQRIEIPHSPDRQDSLAMADALTRALTHRALLAATSGQWVEAPDWWVRGHSLHLLNGGTTAALKEWSDVSEGKWLPPDQWILQPPVEPVSLQIRAQELLFCRWVRHQKKGEEGWKWLAGWKADRALFHLQDLCGAASLREVHIHWALWRAADRDARLSEYRLEQGVLDELEDRARVHPALMGVNGLPERYRPLDLDQLVDSIHLEGVEEMLTKWNLRLQPLAFRQSDDVHLVVKHYLDAGLALGHAAGSSGRKRQQNLERFEQSFLQARKTHHALLLGMNPAQIQEMP